MNHIHEWSFVGYATHDFKTWKVYFCKGCKIRKIDRQFSKGTYPELVKEAAFAKKFKGSKVKYFSSYEKMSIWFNNHHDWQIYTEIEGDTGILYYDRGFHICNRTGNYAAVSDYCFEVMEYTFD